MEKFDYILSKLDLLIDLINQTFLSEKKLIINEIEQNNSFLEE